MACIGGKSSELQQHFAVCSGLGISDHRVVGLSFGLVHLGPKPF